MNRRAFLAALLAASGCKPRETPKGESSDKAVTAGNPIPEDKARTSSTLQGSRIPRVATLVHGTRTAASALAAITGVSAITLVRERLRELGYIEGKTILVEERYADGDPQRQ